MKKIAKILAVILVLSLVLAVCAFAIEDSYSVSDILGILRGVLNGDGSVCTDVNLDGTANLFDVLFALKMAMGGETKLHLTVENTVTVGTSQSSWWERGVQYPRIAVLADGSLLATYEELNAGLVSGGPGYPIYKSTDDGATWERLTTVRDKDATVQSEWNPHLLVLEKPLGNYKAGTVLLAACSIDGAHTTKSAIRLYASTDGGKTFSSPISIAEGGGLDNGVWEPFLMQLDDGRLVCYYSDDTDAAHSQKIVYKVSSDGVTFGDAVEAVASKNADERPGMPVVTRLGDGSYFMVYEVVSHRSVDGNPVMYRTSADGLNFGDPSDLGRLLASGKKALGSAPYCVWTPVGGKHGTLVVSGTFMRSGSSNTGTDYFISRDNGASWETLPHSIPYDASVDHCGYSNCMAISTDGRILYSMNNPTDASVAGHSKIVFAKARWEMQ